MSLIARTPPPGGQIAAIARRPDPHLKFSDAGRYVAGFTDERKDCTVRAASIALEIPYKQAHLEFALLGRKKGKGFSFSRYAASSLRLAKVVGHKRCRVFGALCRYNKGRFVCRIRGHVFAIVDGVVHDRLNDFSMLRNCIVTHVWEATPAPQAVRLLPCTVPAV